jgi:hypothetical protein
MIGNSERAVSGIGLDYFCEVAITEVQANDAPRPVARGA